MIARWHAIALMSVLFISGCAQKQHAADALDRVTVTKLPARIDKQYFDKGVRQEALPVPVHNQYANTNWHFHFRPRFEFDIVARQMKGNEIWVTIKPTSASVEVSLPIVIYLPEGVSEEVLHHELGHVKICEKLYGNSESVARNALSSVIEKTFEGKGKTLKDACQMALDRASQSAGTAYRSQTVDVVNAVSANYDYLSPQHPEPEHVDAVVDAAFQMHEKRDQLYGGKDKNARRK